MKKGTRRYGGPGWDAQRGRWYIFVDNHLVGYVQMLPPPKAKGFHVFRIAPGATAGEYERTCKTVSIGAEILTNLAAGDVPITDDMVKAAIQGHAEYTDEASPDDEPDVFEAMRAALRCALPLLLESRALSAPPPSGIPCLTHEIMLKIEDAWSTARSSQELTSRLIELGVFTGDQWMRDAMAENVPGAERQQRD